MNVVIDEGLDIFDEGSDSDLRGLAETIFQSAPPSSGRPPILILEPFQLVSEGDRCSLPLLQEAFMQARCDELAKDRLNPVLTVPLRNGALKYLLPDSKLLRYKSSPWTKGL